MDTLQEDAAIERVRLELATRKLMVMSLASIGVWVGITVILYGAPNFIETWFSPWSRYAVGGAAFGFGLTTSLAGLGSDRTRVGWWFQVIGLSGLTLWYVAMAASYVILATHQGLDLLGPGEPLHEGVTGRAYVPMVYGGLATMTAIPLLTMFSLGRPRGGSSTG